MKKFAIVILCGLMSVSLSYGQNPDDAVINALYEIDAVTPSTTITAIGQASQNMIYGTPISSPSIAWGDACAGDDVWDFSDGVANSGVYAIPYDLWVKGTVAIDFNDVGAAEGIWMGIGLTDKHHTDGLAIGQDAGITYASGSYGLGWPGGITVVGAAGHSVDDTSTSFKMEDGWGMSGDGGEASLATVNFDFAIRYGFTDGADRDSRTIRGWVKPAGSDPSNWQEWGATSRLGYPPNASSTSRAARYLADQWDQVQVGSIAVFDPPGAGTTGQATFDTLSLQLDALGGDFDLDGDVDVGDLGILATAYGTTGNNWLTGDTDNDGDVDVVDLGTLATYYGQNVAGAAVPEPGTLVLLFSALGLLLIRRR